MKAIEFLRVDRTKRPKSEKNNNRKIGWGAAKSLKPNWWRGETAKP